MHKKLSIVLLFIFSLIVFAEIASAQTATAPSTLNQQRKDAMSQTREEIQALRDQFKARLQTIKDARKKILIERIDAKLAEVNRKHTARFSKVLEIIQGFLNKIKQSTANPEILTDIAAAQAAIDTAKAEIATQSAKIYTITIADDSTLKLNAGTTVSQLRLDLATVHKFVIDAKQAVQKLNTDRGIIKKEATSSANL